MWFDRQHWELINRFILIMELGTSRVYKISEGQSFGSVVCVLEPWVSVLVKFPSELAIPKYGAPSCDIPVDRMSEIIPYIQRCQKYLLHCPAYSLRNDIHLWLLSGAHLWVSPPLTTHQSQFEIFIFHTFRLPPVSTKANHPSGQDSQLQHPSMYTSTEPFYKAYAILIHKAMVLTAIVPLPSHEPGQLLERLRCFKTQRRSLFQRRPFKKSPFQVAEKKKNATSSKQIQGTWCFGLNGHRRDPYVDDSVPEQCRLDVDLL